MARGVADALTRILNLGPSEVLMTSGTEISLAASGIRDRHWPGAEANVLVVLASTMNPAGGGELLTQVMRTPSDEAAPQQFRVVLGSGAVDPTALLAELATLPFVNGGDETALEDLVGRIAGELGVPVALDMGAHRKRLSRVALELRANRKERGALRVLAYAALALIGVVTVGVAVVMFSRSTAPNPADRFGFEQHAHGWVALGGELGGGCVAVRRSDEEAKTGDYALELDMVLDPSRESKRGGEGAWDSTVAATTPRGATLVGPVDLRGKEVSFWVYATAGAEGERESPNGIQLFVKDGAWHSQYSSWSNIEAERWVRLTMAVGERSPGDHMDPELDARTIRLVGVKVSLGARSQLPFEGPVFVDAVTW